MSAPSVPAAPTAPHRQHVREHHGHRVEDPFEWLRDGSDPDVVAYLTAENAYAEAATAHLAPLREAIFTEIRTRTQETDLSVPVRRGGWWYYSRTLEGRQYALHCRLAVGVSPDRPQLEPGDAPDGEQVLLDGNAEAEGHEFFSLGAFRVSPDGDRLAYAVDVAGDERFAMRVKDLRTGEVIDEAVTGTGYGVAWSSDGAYFFYTRVDDAWRPHQVWRHEVGTPAGRDVKVFEEDDERFWMGLGSSRDDRHVLIAVGSKTTSEAWLLDAARPLDPPRVVAPRVDGVEYSVEPAGDRLLVVHNRDHRDFELAWAPLDSPGADRWQTLLAPQDGERIDGVDAFASFAVVSLRSAGLTALRVLPRVDDDPSGYGPPHDVPVAESVYTIGLGSNPSWDADRVQVVLESLVTPRSVYDYDPASRELSLLKRQPVLGGYDPDDYVQHREWATAADGTRVPISLVARNDVVPDSTAPGLLYGYGSYEHSVDPTFSVARLSMLQRGVVFAIAHVRGGGEMGRSWYEQGKLDRKRNTFTDFVACADHLVASGWVSPDRLAAQGRSAGGLLIGAAVNLAPERFRVVHAGVPFVDALTTILDPSLPLTVTEWEEWGNPLEHPQMYEYMRSYTPYENIRPVRYPAVLATTSLNDTRVSFVEPAKWVARLRETVTNEPGERPILLKTEMSAGHGGRSGRYDAWHEYAFELAFVLDQIGATGSA